MENYVIEIDNLHKRFAAKNGDVAALSGINLSVERGEILGIIGFSGAGKSTLVRCMNFLERPNAGSVRFDGVDLASLKEKRLLRLRRKIGMIFQGFNLLEQASVLKNVLFPLEIAGVKREAAREKAEKLLAEVGLSDKLRAYPGELSGGQKQRVAIARALAADPDVLLCDEATSALDPETTSSILALIKGINEKYGITVVVITHQLGVVKSVCDRVAVLDNGRIEEVGEVEKVFASPASAASKRLLAFEGGLL